MTPDHDGYYWILTRCRDEEEWQIGRYWASDSWWGLIDTECGLAPGEVIVRIGPELLPPSEEE